MKNYLSNFTFLFLILILIFTSIYQIEYFNLKENNNDTTENFIRENPIVSYLDLFGLGGEKLGTRDGQNPKICDDDENGAIICWIDSKIYAQRINSSGDVQWIESGIAISPSSGTMPDICKDGFGGAIITWHAGTYPDHNIYAQKVNSTGHLQWDLNAVSICSAIGSQATPQICTDGNGGAIIVWRDYRTGSDPSHELCDIYVQRVNSTGYVQWTTNGILISDTNSYMNSGGKYPRIMSDKEGGAIISWDDNGNIYAQKINSTGDIQWTSNGFGVCEAEGVQEYPTMCSDESGGAYFAWVDQRPPYDLEENVYAQRVDSTGHLQWDINGTVIISKENWQQDVKICEDGLGNAVVTWRDTAFSVGVPTLIYAQKLDNDGNFLWDQQGLLLGNGYSDPHFQICHDETGGTFIGWLYYFDNNYSICIQHVDSNGMLNWRNGGFFMKNVKATDLSMTKDNSGGCIMTWSSYLIDKYEIYIQLINNEDSKPSSNHPSDITTSEPASETIEWVISDDSGSGQYRVLTNDSEGNNIVWVNWTTWQDNSPISINLSLQALGDYFYTLEFFDIHNQLGLPDTVIVRIESSPPPENPPPFIPGYEIHLLLGFSIVITYFLIRKKWKT